jgi:VIT1/CCC1 family predicted Fe2+/Mn2+ transporter
MEHTPPDGEHDPPPRSGWHALATRRMRLRRALLDAHEPRTARDLARHYLRDLVYGANDGIITTFAVVSGVAGAALPARTALVLGVANLLADGVSMGAGSFLSIRSDEAVRRARAEPPAEPFPARHGIATFLAFVAAGVVPLVPYALASPERRFGVAVAATMATLFLVGAMRAWVTQLRWWLAGLEVLAVGAAAAGVSYGVGAFLGSHL